jgi:hypothetical protein
MENLEDIRLAVEAILGACGDLQDRYDEPEALSLMRALGRHCPVTAAGAAGLAPDFLTVACPSVLITQKSPVPAETETGVSSGGTIQPADTLAGQS